MLVTPLIMHIYSQPSMHSPQCTASLFRFNLLMKKTAFCYDSISECYINFSYSIAVLHLYEVCMQCSNQKWNIALYIYLWGRWQGCELCNWMLICLRPKVPAHVLVFSLVLLIYEVTRMEFLFLLLLSCTISIYFI